MPRQRRSEPAKGRREKEPVSNAFCPIVYENSGDAGSVFYIEIKQVSLPFYIYHSHDLARKTLPPRRRI